jgi:asparagine synthase (glutamine-hydrolysing)
MCGIFGLVGNACPADLAIMGRTLRHRGPDDEGYVLLDAHARPAAGPDTVRELVDLPRIDQLPARQAWPVGFGHRRLSIIDLTCAGHQPMSTADARFWISFNGEIYNHRELREKLTAAGHRFVSRSDTEVVLAAYAAWGLEALARLEGMFAFALHDLHTAQTMLVRDRFGIKPLFYSRCGDGLVFASEIKAIRAVRRLTVNDAAIFHFLAGTRMPRDAQTFYREVSLLEPGHLLFCSDSRIEKRRWYTPPDFPEALGSDDSDEEAAHRFAALFSASVKAHLVSDIPVGYCLSGGLDSSAIVSQVARLRGFSPGRSFSIVFPGESVDERSWMDLAIEDTGVEPAFTTATAAAALEDLPALCRTHDAPFPDWSLHAQAQVMRLTQAHGIKVLLDGQGNDELMAGYGGGIACFLSQVRRDRGEAAYLAQLNLFRRHTDYAFLRRSDPLLPVAPSAPGLPLLVDDFHRRFTGTDRRSTEGHDSLNRMLHELFFKTSLPQLLLWEDHNSMACSIEARVPFVDAGLVDFVFSQPGDRKLRDGWTKWLLRHGLKEIMPDRLRWRESKFGYSVPNESWLRQQKEGCLRLIDERADVGREYIDRDRIRRFGLQCSEPGDLGRLFRATTTLVFLSN